MVLVLVLLTERRGSPRFHVTIQSPLHPTVRLRLQRHRASASAFPALWERGEARAGPMSSGCRCAFWNAQGGRCTLAAIPVASADVWLGSRVTWPRRDKWADRPAELTCALSSLRSDACTLAGLVLP
ncbi:hypothetical protein SKAU_G00072290 [Synaphobranchus kaupii]|uniref:Uncharacterized protein n=1 Tax=Synaphobranchus kaupii TaxID=118154 RepID=A0A9Q1J9M8_SYNKA|nr:hypothetical protein SKAU_G00072290 [Synaphobranchus kaupii]